jgi:hypothetical protein
MARRHYSNVTQPVALVTPATNVATSLEVSTTAGFPVPPFTIGLERGTLNEEVCLVTAVPDGSHFTANRGYDGTTSKAHDAGSTVEHVTVALDYDAANAHIENEVADPHPQYLFRTGGVLTGDLDFDGNDLIDPIVSGARDKRYSANISGAVVINADNGPSQTLTLVGNVTGLTVTNLEDGEQIRVTLLEDVTGGRTIQAAFNAAGWVWVGGVATATAVFKTTASARNTLVLEKIGSVTEAFLVGDQKA